MNREHLGVGAADSDPEPEAILERYDLYIVALVGQMGRSSSNLARPEVLDLEIDEMAQRVRIKFWLALVDKHIEHHKAYIRTMVRNEFNDLSRRRKAPLSLIFDEDGELYMGEAVEIKGVGMADPADEFEENERMDELMDSTVSAVKKLSPRQQKAMVCEINEKIDSCLQFMEFLSKHQVEPDSLDWPEDEADKKLLKASLSPARQKMAASLDYDLETHKRKM